MKRKVGSKHYIKARPELISGFTIKPSPGNELYSLEITSDSLEKPEIIHWSNTPVMGFSYNGLNTNVRAILESLNESLRSRIVGSPIGDAIIVPGYEKNPIVKVFSRIGRVPADDEFESISSLSVLSICEKEKSSKSNYINIKRYCIIVDSNGKIVPEDFTDITLSMKRLYF